MFKQFPDVVVTQGCGNVQNADYNINWEEIARWALEHGVVEEARAQAMPVENAAPNNGPPIDWCQIADSFMRDEAAGNIADLCNANEINESMRASVLSDVHYPSESVSRLAAEGFGEGLSPVPYKGRTHSPSPPRRRARPRVYSYSGDSELNRSMRDSDFNNTSCYDRTPLSSIHDFSCMDGSFMHDSTQKSDIMSYLEAGTADKIRPHSIAEGYHFPGSAYGRADDDNYRVFTSTPKKKQRTTRAETFEMPDGSKMFNVTFEECLGFGRRLRHISDVRDQQGCQIMHMDREINEEPNGARHRVDIARRWLDFDQDEAGCS